MKTGGETESGRSLLAARHDDNGDDNLKSYNSMQIIHMIQENLINRITNVK